MPGIGTLEHVSFVVVRLHRRHAAAAASTLRAATPVAAAATRHAPAADPCEGRLKKIDDHTLRGRSHRSCASWSAARPSRAACASSPIPARTASSPACGCSASRGHSIAGRDRDQERRPRSPRSTAARSRTRTALLDLYAQARQLNSSSSTARAAASRSRITLADCAEYSVLAQAALLAGDGSRRRESPDARSAPPTPPIGGALAVGAGIFLSRIAGLVRERAFAHYLGLVDGGRCVPRGAAHPEPPAEPARRGRAVGVVHPGLRAAAARRAATTRPRASRARSARCSRWSPALIALARRRSRRARSSTCSRPASSGEYARADDRRSSASCSPASRCS